MRISFMKICFRVCFPSLSAYKFSYSILDWTAQRTRRVGSWSESSLPLVIPSTLGQIGDDLVHLHTTSRAHGRMIRLWNCGRFRKRDVHERCHPILGG